MGIPVPPPPVIGDLCFWCDGILWPAGFTPMFVKCTLADIVECAIANFVAPNTTFVLKQNPDISCQWNYSDAKYTVLWVISQYWTSLECREAIVPYRLFFRHTNYAACQLDFINEFVICDGTNAGRFGTGEIVLI